VKKLAIAFAAALALAVPASASAQGGAPPTGICATTPDGWAVFANNKWTTCDFAIETFFALQAYQVGHTIHYNTTIVIPVRSGTTGHLWRIRCHTEKYPSISALCRSKPPGMNMTISRVIDANNNPNK
jgi:hypothetical protein